MTVNKLQLPAKQNVVQLKINEIIDNLSGASITIDNTLSTTSTNPVQNKVITTELNKKIEGINSSDVISALGYIPYNSTNPNNYTSNIGTVTSVNNVTPANGNVTLSIPTKTSDLTNDSNFINSSALAPYELINKPVTTLANSGTLALTDNTAYKIENANGAITFTLPTISDTAKFHQIVIQLYMASAQTINLSTTYYFTGEAPDMSEAGYYTIIYEYDNTKSSWAVGALKKASV